MMAEPNGLSADIKDKDIVEALFYAPRNSKTSRDPMGGFFRIAKAEGAFDQHPQGEGNPKKFIRVLYKAGWLRKNPFEVEQEFLEPRYVNVFMDKDAKAQEVPEEMVREKAGVRGYNIQVPIIKTIMTKDDVDGGTVEFAPKLLGFQDEWYELPKGISPVLRYDKHKRLTHRKRLDVSKLSFDTSVFTPEQVEAVDVVSDGEFNDIQTKYDTHKNALYTIGTGKTFGTITGWLTAASSGDVGEVYPTTGNTYTESLGFGAKCGLQLICPPSVGYQTITITNSSGTVINLIGGSQHEVIRNFKVIATGTAVCGLNAYYSCYYSTLQDLYISGGTTGAARGYVGTRFINCVFVSSAGYGLQSDQTVQAFNCFAAKNGTYGFSGTGAALICYHCISAGNVTAAWTALNGGGAWNVSDDATAPGYSPVTGFLTSDCENWAGNDFRLCDAVKLTTKARFLGYPVNCDYDAYGGKRKRTGIVFAGPHDPDPETTPPTVPTGLALTDAKTYGMLKGTVTNIGSFVATDVLAFYDNSTGLEVDRCSVALYNRLGFAPVGNMTNNMAYTLHAKSSHDGVNWSAASATATGTPTWGTSQPLPPSNVVLTWSGTTLVAALTALNPTDKIYVRYKLKSALTYSAEDGALSRTGSGVVNIPALNPTSDYIVEAYVKG